MLEAQQPIEAEYIRSFELLKTLDNPPQTIYKENPFQFNKDFPTTMLVCTKYSRRDGLLAII